MIIFFCMITLISCKTLPDDDQTLWMMMRDYYEDNLKLPENAEDYCNRVYQEDSIHGFEHILGNMMNVPRTDISYNDYWEYIDSIYTALLRDSILQPPVFFNHYMYHNKESLDIEKTRSFYKLYNRKNGETHITYNIEDYVIKYFCKHKKIKHKASEVNFLYDVSRISFHNIDSINITDKYLSVDDIENLNHKVFAVIKNINDENAKVNQKKYKRYLVLYDRKGNMSTFPDNKAVPQIYSDSKSLRRLLDKFMTGYPDIHLIKFSIYGI